MKRKIVIFDLDGTLLNTLEDLTDSTNFALKNFNYPVKTIEQVCNYVGNGVAKLIERAIPDGRNNSDFEKCLDLFKRNYSENMYNKTAPYPGIIDMLSELRSAGCKIAVVSNKFDAAVKELCEKYFPNLIDVAIGENESAGIKKKPAPDTVLKAVCELGASINECIYVGDSDVDIMTAKNSKMPCISVTWGFRSIDFLKKSGANIIVNSPSAIITCLDN